MSAITRIEDRMPPANPQERHLAAVLLVDCSSSMLGKPMEELNEGLKLFGEALAQDEEALDRVDVSVISFASEVKTEMGFRPAGEYAAPVLKADGLTSFNQGVNLALDELEARKQTYRDAEVNYYMPWLFVLTDGYPTDQELEEETRRRLRDAVAGSHVNYIPMALGSQADAELLLSYYPETYTDREGNPRQKVVLKAALEDFKGAFQWLSNSMTLASGTDPKAGVAESAPVPSTISIAVV